MAPSARRSLAVLAAVALIGLAGCVGWVWGDGDPQDIDFYGGENASTPDDGDGNASGGDGEAADRTADDEDANGSDVDADGTDATDDGGDVRRRRRIVWAKVLQPWTTETLQIRYENDTVRDVRLAGIRAPAHEEPVSANHSFAKIGSDTSALDCLERHADEAWKYLHNTGGTDYRVVHDNETEGVHLVERGGAATLNERYLREGYAQYEGSWHYAERYRAAQRAARLDHEGLWFCAPRGTIW